MMTLLCKQGKLQHYLLRSRAVTWYLPKQEKYDRQPDDWQEPPMCPSAYVGNTKSGCKAKYENSSLDQGSYWTDLSKHQSSWSTYNRKS